MLLVEIPQLETRVHKFIEPTGEVHIFELHELEDVIRDIWKRNVVSLPYQLIDEYDGGIALRYARHMPQDIAHAIFEDEFDFDEVIAWAVIAYYESTQWTICWAMPIFLHTGPGELFYCGPEGVRVSQEDMREIV